MHTGVGSIASPPRILVAWLVFFVAVLRFTCNLLGQIKACLVIQHGHDNGCFGKERSPPSPSLRIGQDSWTDRQGKGHIRQYEIGHVVSKILLDILVRRKRTKGVHTSDPTRVNP